MLEFIINNQVDIAIVAIILVGLVLFLVTKNKSLLYSAALYAVSVAEEEFGSDTGKIKFAKVMTYLRKTYPIITLFIPEKKLTDIIEKQLLEMKRILKAKKDKAESENKFKSDELSKSENNGLLND